MAPFGYGVWMWLKGNPVAQGILAAGVGLSLLWGYLGLRDGRVRRDERMKSEVKARKTASKVIAKQKDEANERLKEIEDAGAKAVKDMPDGDDVDYADSVPDDLAEFIFGDRRDG